MIKINLISPELLTGIITVRQPKYNEVEFDIEKDSGVWNLEIKSRRVTTKAVSTGFQIKIESLSPHSTHKTLDQAIEHLFWFEKAYLN